MDEMGLVRRSVLDPDQIPNWQIEAEMKSQDLIHLGYHRAHFEQREHLALQKLKTKILHAGNSQVD
jgi:hypothetical protein